MIHKVILNSVFKFKYSYFLSIRHSALFINGLKATDTFVYVTPHIDFPECIKHKEDIKLNILKRKSNVDLTKVENLWLLYEDLKKKKIELEKKKIDVTKELSNLLKNSPNDKDIEKLKIQSSLLKENIKKLKVPFWSAEEAAIVEYLKLPNNLHMLTPSTENKLLFNYKTSPNNNKNHFTIGTGKDLLQFTRKDNYYLKGDAAVFELGAKFYVSNILKDNGFTQFSSPDFVKSLIIEGCGGDHTNPNHTFILHHNEDSKVSMDNRLHLTGGGSLLSFLAYYTKNILYAKVLPLKYFSLGRQYTPANSEETSLFNVSQSSAITTFIAVRNADECDIMLEKIIEMTKMMYTKLGYPFRLSVVTADKLQMWESLRISVEMYSCSMKSFIEIGNISVSGDFLCKRLMFSYTDGNQNKYPHILSGTILNVPKFLGCVLEQDYDFFIPPEFMVEKWYIKK